MSAQTLRKAHAIHPISAVQSEYSLWTRDPESEVLPACRELGVTFVPYSPLGRGFLTGTFALSQDPKDFRQHLPRFLGDNANKNTLIVDIVKVELPRFHGQFIGSRFRADCALKAQAYPRGLPVDKPTYP